MARIRTIKPEFPQSESMGRVTRDARLTFIQLWSLADDSGRLRGNSRMLASLLFPYDDDAKDLIDVWLNELESEACLRRYKVGGDSYLEISNWLKHQKIDKPSKSKITSFDDASRILASARESSSEDQGPKDQGSKDQGPDREPRGQLEPPTPVDNLSQHEAPDGAGIGLAVRPEEQRPESSLNELPERTHLPEAFGTPCLAASISMALRKEGVQCQPTDPRIVALAEQGTTVELVLDALTHARKSKPDQPIALPYLIAILMRWAKEAKAIKVTGACAPLVKGPHWSFSEDLTYAEGKRLGITPLPGESMHIFKGRVQAALDAKASPAPTAPVAVPEAQPAASVKTKPSPEVIAARRACINQALKGTGATA